MKNKKWILTIITLGIITAALIFNMNNRVKYTNEYPYLPTYKNLQVDKYELPKNGQFGNAIYYVKESKYDNFLLEYQKIFVKDGWKITSDKKPESFEAVKGEHIAKVNAVNSKDKIIVLIWTK